MTDLHFLDSNGNHFVVPDAPEGYARDDATVIDPPPSLEHRWINGSWVLPPAPEPEPITEADIIAERERRLALGFDYDFGDDRGVHHIGTTPDDMEKWIKEVSPIAQALINVGQHGGTIGISTDTGPVDVTAAEWQQILLAAGNWRQPIYKASFDLMTMDPLPADYADDERWT